MSLYYRTLLSNTNTIQVNFLTKTTDPGNNINLTTDTLNVTDISTSTGNNLRIFTTSTNYLVKVYRNGILYQTFNRSGDTICLVSYSLGLYTYFITGPVNMTFTSQLIYAPVFAPDVNAFNTVGQTIT